MLMAALVEPVTAQGVTKLQSKQGQDCFLTAAT